MSQCYLSLRAVLNNRRRSPAALSSELSRHLGPTMRAPELRPQMELPLEQLRFPFEAGDVQPCAFEGAHQENRSTAQNVHIHSGHSLRMLGFELLRNSQQ